MDAARAAAVLGVAPDAGRDEIVAAFARRARVTHPDVVGGDGAAFREALAARDLLLALADAPPPPRGGGPAPQPQGPLLLAVWAALVAVAAFVSIYGVEHPLHPAEAVVRWILLAAAAVAYGATGRRVFLVTALVLAGFTAIMTLVETSFGGLVGLLLLIPALYGLSLSGIGRRRRRSA